jgi:hypothetical protein
MLPHAQFAWVQHTMFAFRPNTIRSQTFRISVICDVRTYRCHTNVGIDVVAVD